MNKLLVLVLLIPLALARASFISGGGGGTAITPNSCTASEFANGIDASGTLTCNAPPEPAPAPPITVNLALNLDATNCATRDCVLGLGNKVTQWNDLSGNGRNHTNGDPSRDPTYVASGINSLPSIQFDRSTPTNLMAPSAVALTEWSAYIVAQWTSPLGGFFMVTPSGTTGGIFTGDAVSFELYDGGSYADFSASYAANTPYIYQIIAPSNPASAAVYQTDATMTPTGNGGSSWAMNYQNIGSRGSASGPTAFNGYISQYLLYTVAHNSTERATTKAFLKARWGIP